MHKSNKVYKVIDSILYSNGNNRRTIFMDYYFSETYFNVYNGLSFYSCEIVL